MNGGLLDAIERLSRDEIDQAVSGFRYFGLNDAAAIVVSITQRVDRLDVADLDAGEQLEAEADDRYAEAVPDDSTLATRFEQAFRQRPDAFAPIR